MGDSRISWNKEARDLAKKHQQILMAFGIDGGHLKGRGIGSIRAFGDYPERTVKVLLLTVCRVTGHDVDIEDAFAWALENLSKEHQKPRKLGKHERAVKALLGSYGCQRQRYEGGKTCREHPGAATLCAVCNLCQDLGIELPTDEDRRDYAESQR